MTTKLVPKLVIPKSVAYQVLEYIHAKLLHHIGRNKLVLMIEKNNILNFLFKSLFNTLKILLYFTGLGCF